MKKIMTLLACSALLIFGACNKNKKFNKTLDGTWITISENGQAVSASEATKIAFSKTGTDNGNATITIYDSTAVSSVLTGTYKITDKGKTLTINATETVPAQGNIPAYTLAISMAGAITDQDKSKFTYSPAVTVNGAGTDAKVWIFTKQ